MLKDAAPAPPAPPAAREPIPLWFVLPVLERGGAERVVAELARRLPARGFAPAVCCLEDEAAPLGLELKRAGVPVWGLNCARRHTWACARALAERLAEARPALIHAHLFHANLAARLAARRLARAVPDFRPRVLSTVHVQERRFRPWQFFLDRATARWCAVEVCVAPSVERFHRARTGLPASFFRVIENGIDRERFAACTPAVRFAARRRFGISDGERLVLAVGRLNVQKDHRFLLRVWRRAALPKARLWIAGEGPERKKLETRLPENAQLLGFRKDVPELLAACDLFVQPSAWEGQPLTVLEAMAAGCAVAASDIEAHTDTLEENRTGILLPKGNVQAWAAAIADLLDDEPRRARLGAAARDEARTRFSAERMADDYAALYRDLLERA